MNKRRTGWAAALLLGLCAAALAWWWWQAAQAARTRAATLAQAEAAAAAREKVAALAPLSAASQAALAALDHPWPATGWEADAPGSRHCAADPAPLRGGLNSAALSGQASPAAAAHAVQALSASPEPEAQALAIWWPSISAGVAAAAALNERTAACADHRPCERQAFARYVSQRVSARDLGTQALAELATSTRHPTIYAMALEACKEHPWSAARAEPAQCQRITLKGWAEADPDNAMPWLHLASQALLQQDDQGVADALLQASQAQRVRQHGHELLHVAQKAWQALPEAEQMVLGLQLVSLVQAPWTPPNLGVVAHYCSNEALLDPARRPTCEGLAKLLLGQGRLMAEHHTGLRLAERLGWPAAQLEPLQQEREALHAALEISLQPDRRASPCAAMRQRLHVNSLISQLGEVGMARTAVARSGLAMGAFAERHALQLRQQQQIRRAAGAGAAPGAWVAQPAPAEPWAPPSAPR